MFTQVSALSLQPDLQGPQRPGVPAPRGEEEQGHPWRCHHGWGPTGSRAQSPMLDPKTFPLQILFSHPSPSPAMGSNWFPLQPPLMKHCLSPRPHPSFPWERLGPNGSVSMSRDHGRSELGEGAWGAWEGARRALGTRRTSPSLSPAM